MEVHVELAAEKLFSIGPIHVTNSMLMMFVVMGLLVIIFSSIARRAQIVPGRGQGFLELIVEFLLGLVEGTAGKKLGRSIFPLISAIFIFIAFSNYSGLLPGVGTIGYWKDEVAEVPAEHVTTEGTTTGEETANTTDGAAATTSEEVAAHEESHRVLVPFLRAPNADLNMTLAMALITFFAVQYAGIKAHGVGGRIRHMAQPWWIFPLEVIQELARIVSLSFRLFGNIFAGEVLLAVMYAMAAAIKVAIIPLLFPVILLFLEVLFGTIQALVFALLTLIYITLAASGAHGDHEPEDEPIPAPHPATGAAVAHGAGD
jgi:F-type H+-transporting ATPase subunit a